MLSLLVVFASLMIVGATLFFKDFGHQRTITVTATGLASASPAMATVYVTMNATGMTASLANANLSARVNEFNTTVLPFLNGNVSRIQTTSYQVYQPSNCTYVNVSNYCIYKKLDYYIATESMSVTIPSISNASNALTQMLAIQNLQLQSVQATLSNSQKTALNQEALTQALTNATSQAKALAGSESIRVENISVQSSVIYPYYYSVGAASSATPGAKTVNSTVFYGGTISAQKSVYVVFSMR